MWAGGHCVLPHPWANINQFRNRRREPRTVPKSSLLTPESLARMCLGLLAEDPGQLAEFMSVAGYTPQSLRAALGSAQLGQGLIDYFAGNEALLLALCANNQLRPDDFMRVWATLNPAG